MSVVSHGQLDLVERLLDDLSTYCAETIEVVLTLNVPEPALIDPSAYPFDVRVIGNESPKGFGANHNAAFECAAGTFFCVVNPDVRLDSDPFPVLVGTLGDPGVGVVGPRVTNPEGDDEDSGRVFPTVRLLVTKLWRRVVRRLPGRPDYPIGNDVIHPDWIGGMCMVFRSSVFQGIGGFDERYFLYYEDVDLCWRLRRAGYLVALQPAAVVVHGARRSSWTNWRYMRWHISSMTRFLLMQARR